MTGIWLSPFSKLPRSQYSSFFTEGALAVFYASGAGHTRDHNKAANERHKWEGTTRYCQCEAHIRNRRECINKDSARPESHFKLFECGYTYNKKRAREQK